MYLQYTIRRCQKSGSEIFTAVKREHPGSLEFRQNSCRSLNLSKSSTVECHRRLSSSEQCTFLLESVFKFQACIWWFEDCSDRVSHQTLEQWLPLSKPMSLPNSSFSSIPKLRCMLRFMSIIWLRKWQRKGSAKMVICTSEYNMIYYRELRVMSEVMPQINKTKQNKTKQNKTKQNKTKQNKTKQNKTKRNKTKCCEGKLS
jgi:hypothetical protein